MIRVNKKFYESGCTIDGRGNRVFLKGKDGEVNLQMTFLKNKVEIIGGPETRIVDFKNIKEICTTNDKTIMVGPFPAIQLK